MEDILALKKLALLSGFEGVAKVSSADFADQITSSPQTASRRLQSLEQAGYITRKIGPFGQQVRITKKGRQALQEEYLDYRRIFSTASTPIELKGHVITGLGEGQYYINLKGYRDQFSKLLGFVPFPGTLNVRLDAESTGCRALLNLKEGIRIEGFSSENRTFGGGRCYRVFVGDRIEGAIMIPDRTHYPEDIIEIISAYNLREQLKLKDNSKISVLVE